MINEGIIRFGSILIGAVWILKLSVLLLMLPRIFSGLHYSVVGLHSWQEEQVNGAVFLASGSHPFPLIGVQMHRVV